MVEGISNDYEDNLRTVPTSQLDVTMMVTDNVWGRPNVSNELKDILNKYYLEKNDRGEDIITKQSLWGLLSYYTRDIRLGNLSEWNGELQACRYYLVLAGDLLYAGLIEPFLVALSQAIAIIETSQSKSGFLRRQMNTLRSENIHQQMEAPKKGFFGSKSGEGGQ
jgi:hypothetical protein